MGIPQENPSNSFTYADYRSWSHDERWELINGQAWAMSPAPNRRHQGLLGTFTDSFQSFFRNKKCKVYFAPFDVVLPKFGQKEDESDTVVQPDLVVICDLNKLTDAGCTGAPDLAIEILSPSTAYKDMDQKLKLYERSGVKEYWIVNPANATVMVYRQVAPASFGKPLLFARGDRLEAGLYPGLIVNLNDAFAE